MQKLQGR